MMRDVEDAVCQWAMERGRFGVGGFDVRRVRPGLYEACVELASHYGEKKPPRRRFVASGSTRQKAHRACVAMALRAMAYELSPREASTDAGDAL